MYLEIFLSVLVIALIISIVVIMMILNGALKFNNVLSAELKEARQIIISNNEISQKLDRLLNN